MFRLALWFLLIAVMAGILGSGIFDHAVGGFSVFLIYLFGILSSVTLLMAIFSDRDFTSNT